MVPKYTDTVRWQLIQFCLAAFLVFCSVFTSLAQGPTALVVQFEHRTNASLAYPDYFDDVIWTNSIFDYLQSWMKERYGVVNLHYKRLNPIGYTPVLGREEEIKSLSRTGFDFGVQILSSLESGLFERKMRDNEGRLNVKIRIYDDRGKIVFKGQVYINILIKLKRQFQGNAFMARRDFQNLYRDALMMATYSKPLTKFFQFEQPEDSALISFMRDGQHCFLQRTSRGRYDMQISPDSSLVLSLELQSPEENKDGYQRGAEWENPVNSEQVESLGRLNPRFPDEVRLELTSEQYVLGNAQCRYFAEEYVLKGNLKGVKFKFSKNLRQPVFSFYLEEELWALGVLKDQNPGSFERYDLYLKPQAHPEDVTLFMHVLGLETTREAVRKYFRVETKE